MVNPWNKLKDAAVDAPATNKLNNWKDAEPVTKGKYSLRSTKSMQRSRKITTITTIAD